MPKKVIGVPNHEVLPTNAKYLYSNEGYGFHFYEVECDEQGRVLEDGREYNINRKQEESSRDHKL